MYGKKYLLFLFLFYSQKNFSQTILLTGGAGYIGSHVGYYLHQNKHTVIIIDKFEHNQPFCHQWAQVYHGDFSDSKLLNKIFTENTIDCVMHFAAYAYVGESMKNPFKYYENNLVKTITLVKKMIQRNIKNLIFSSSCTVYGIPPTLPITEDMPFRPISPYGATKASIELFLEQLSTNLNFKYVSLRYFNATGTCASKGLCEFHQPEPHVIPLAIRACLSKKSFKVFGSDYPTKDGTCIRDYLHVQDIANAHLAALNYLQKENRSNIFNLGTGKGYSVLEILDKVEKVCKKPLNKIFIKRREGDPAILYANASKAKEVLGWTPQFSSLQNIIQSAYEGELLFRKIIST